MFKGCAEIAAAEYYVKRFEVTKNVSYPYTLAPVILGSASGLSAANPNGGDYYMAASNVTETSATLQTYVYQMVDSKGTVLGWFPVSPDNVTFSFSVLSKIDQDVYLQDKTETGTVNYNAMLIQGGDNVTSSVPQGDYVVQSGANVVLQAGDAVYFGPNVALQPGSVVCAYINTFFTCSQFPHGRMAAVGPDSAHSEEIVDYLNSYKTTFQKANGESEQGFRIKSLYPIPFTDQFTIEYYTEASENITVSLCSAEGEELIQLKNISRHEQGTYKIELDGLNLPLGAYIVKIVTNQKVITKKVIKI